MKLWRAIKLPTFTLSFAARTRHAPLLANNSCTRGELSKRGELTNARSALVGVAETGVNALFDDFWYFWSLKSARRKKFLYASSRVVVGADPYKIKSEYIQQTKAKMHSPSRQRTY